MACFDTTFLIDYWRMLYRDDAEGLAVLEGVMLEHELKVSAITAGELLWGAYNLGTESAIEVAKSILRRFKVLPFDSRAADIYASISTSLKQKGTPLKAFDELIAATAIRFNEPLITNDKEFKRVAGLEVIEYLPPKP